MAQVEEEYCRFIIPDQAEVLIKTDRLTQQSPVIAAMFQHDCQERRNHTVVVPDISLITLQTFKRYIEGTAVGELGSVRAIDLLYCAKKYCVSTLENRLHSYLQLTLSAETIDLIFLFLKLEALGEEALMRYTYGLILNAGYEVLPIGEELGTIGRDFVEKLISEDRFFCEEMNIYRFLIEWATEKIKLEKRALLAEEAQQQEVTVDAEELQAFVGDLKFHLRPNRVSTLEWTVGPAENLLTPSERDTVHRKRFHMKGAGTAGFTFKNRYRPPIWSCRFQLALGHFPAVASSLASEIEVRGDLMGHSADLFVALWRSLGFSPSLRVMTEPHRVFIRLAALQEGQRVELFGGRSLTGGDKLPVEEEVLAVGPGVVLLTKTAEPRQGDGGLMHYYDLDIFVDWSVQRKTESVPVGIITGERTELLRICRIVLLEKGLDALSPKMDLFIKKA